jgi:transcriptional regulator with PAS, ATPase and Fis domain
MTSEPSKRIDLEAWLADLRRLGGQARTLSEKHATLPSIMSLSDLQMLEEATKRIIVSLTRNPMYGLPSPPDWEGAVLAGTPRPVRASAYPAQAAEDRADAESGSDDHRASRHGIIGQTDAMRRVHELIEKAAACSLPVLIQGESGTGKELVARAIHERSGRQERRFFSENCSALSESLLESELFGHVRGAFTGADRDRKGIFELAHGGTLFLDEIGDTSLRMQSKLLRALQEREIRPVGAKDTIRVDVRIISATNRSVRSLIKEGLFREDLFYRINVITISLPPLRERREDIPALVDCFLDRIAGDTGLPRKVFSTGALELLTDYDWPGNIRELENITQRAVALSARESIQPHDLPDRIRHVMITEEQADYSKSGKGGEQLMIEKALHNFEGDKTAAARFIGWSRPKLYRRMRHYGIGMLFGRTERRSRG